ncbi:SurA N-terminal domain-containing protein [Candidatus Saccharibacteria bacterium]|nr:SurA N-terminal domain-containing protein [Candidatus Saccharibacteria bacterium]
MKKLLNNLNKIPRPRRKKALPDSSRITTETIAEHRERILAGGRRFKYPVQYARHRLVFNAIIITIVTLIALIGVGYWQLYSAQNTSDFIYRVTRVLPLPVAKIDGEPVLYSDYLMKYRSSIHYLETKERINLKTEDGNRQSDFVKSQAMDDALADAYAGKLAKQNNVTVSDVELQTYLKQQRSSTDGEVSKATYNAVILDYYGWSPAEYEHAMKTKLLRQKVSFVVDTDAEAASKVVGATITAGNTDLKSVVETVNKTAKVQVEYGALGFVPKTNQDGGLAVAAAKLTKSQISTVIKSTTGDGYYFIKLLDSKETEVSYEFVHIPLTFFTQQLKAVKDQNKVQVFITIPEVAITPAN